MSKPIEGGVAIWYYDYDGLGSVTEITDWQGNALEKYTYDEYGSFTMEDGGGNPLTSSPSGNRFFFTGREWDSLTGLYYYRARWYDAKIGRFLQVDPVGYDARDINLYRYCKNNPVNLVDSDGKIATEKTWWQKLGEGYYYGTEYGQSALEWYAQKDVETGKWYYAAGGSMVAL